MSHFVYLFLESQSKYIFFFFFQAEDGIRDYKVTGVQTCALPILGMNLEANRYPHFGPQVQYGFSNIGGSFVNATASYTTINTDQYPGQPDEKAWFVHLDRPLYSPYAHLAGGFTIGQFEDFNVYRFADSLFYKY